MLLKGTKLYSIFAMKCPRCHEGEVFVENNPYKLKSLFKMHQKCDVCELKYEPEPNFYYGAMYVSYGYTVALFIAIFVLGRFLLNIDLLAIIIFLTVLLIALSPYIFRLSRITYLNLFVRYKKDAGKNKD